jgi:hypothetical protein
MKTNDIKKGAEVMLASGWRAILQDNARGNIRTAKVFGHMTEIGSIYSHDIVAVLVHNQEGEVSHWEKIEHTESQEKCRKNAARLLDPTYTANPRI